MKIQLHQGLLYVPVTLMYRQQQVAIDKVILDTGSTNSIFSVDSVNAIALFPEPQDVIHQIRGVGGREFVFTKKVDRLQLGELQVQNFDIEIGAMQYGFELNGIIGLDFLLQTKATIDLSQMEINLPVDH